MIDVHNHSSSEAARSLVEASYSPEQIRANEPYEVYLGESSRTSNRARTSRPKMLDTDLRLADMDRMGVDVQVLATYVSQLHYWVDGELGQRIARVQNERLAEMAAQAPQRFAAIGTVPMQDAGRAVAELDHLVNDLGFKGVQISSNVAGRDLDDPRFRPFWKRAEELGAVVLIHPNAFTQGERFQDYFMVNVVGNPLDSTLALTRLIFSGVLAQHPALKVCVVHGGGYLPFYSARMDHAFEVRPECREHIEEPPSTYLKQVYFDTMVFSPRLLRNLVEFVGADHVLLGTDYPFDMGDDDPVALVDSVEGLDETERRMIRGENAARLFSIG